jgi:hypothetical protein
VRTKFVGMGAAAAVPRHTVQCVRPNTQRVRVGRRVMRSVIKVSPKSEPHAAGLGWRVMGLQWICVCPINSSFEFGYTVCLDTYRYRIKMGGGVRCELKWETDAIVTRGGGRCSLGAWPVC